MSGSTFLRSIKAYSRYRDRDFSGTQEEYDKALLSSSTVYVGNLAFYTTEEQIYEVFSCAGGEIKRIIMGLDKVSHSPCGFCFVEFYDAADARRAEYLVSGGLILVDERAVKVDADLGFKEGRQFGRGLQGFQKRDERLQHSRDPGRPSLYRQSEQQSKPRSRSRERARGGGGGGGDRDRGRDRDRDTRGRARRERSRSRSSSRSSGSDSDSEHGSRKRLRDADAEVPMLDDEPAVKAAKEEAEEEKH